MKLACYQLLHVGSMVLLTAVVFQAFANPDPTRRKSTLCAIGCLALAMLVGGFGLVATMKVGFPAWVVIKLLCWLGLVAVGGLGYRRPRLIPVLTVFAGVLLFTAIVTVYFRHVIAGNYE